MAQQLILDFFGAQAKNSAKRLMSDDHSVKLQKSKPKADSEKLATRGTERADASPENNLLNHARDVAWAFDSASNGGESEVNKQRLQEQENEKDEQKVEQAKEYNEENTTAKEESTKYDARVSEADGGSFSTKEASKLIELSKQTATCAPFASGGSKIPYSRLTDVLEKIEHEPGRLKITALVSEFFLEVLQQNPGPEKITHVVYLFINRLGPDYEPDLELGLGETLLIKAISECYGRSVSKIKADYKEAGDLGIVAQLSRAAQPTMFKATPLEVDQVFANLTKIAKTAGKDSQARKIGIIKQMLTSCERGSNEAKFLVRSLEGKLRIGLAERTVLVALAQALLNAENTSGRRVLPESLSRTEDIMREAFSLVPNYEIIIRTALQHRVGNLLEHCQLKPGVPLKPMLAKPTKSIGEVLDRFQGVEFTCEYKYDGERAQVHLMDTGEVRVYSRNSEDMSQRYPDLVAIVKDFVRLLDPQNPPKLMILDCEAVAYDREAKKILPFQVLSTRKRKDVSEKDIKVHICLFAFDVLCYNSESMIMRSFGERRQCLLDNFAAIEGKFQFAMAKNLSNLDELQAFLDQSVKDSCEGLMVKMLHGPESYYEPSKRSRNWLKLKKDYLAGVGDSLDLVVVGAYLGKGKRTGLYGGFLLATYNDDTGEYETTCKIGTGFSDEDLASLYTRLKPSEIAHPKPFYLYDTKNASSAPDIWLEPTMVFEVLVADLSLSPIYKAGHSEYNKGVSLRFPRFIRVRDDKRTEDATTSAQIAELYERQASVAGS